jgi:hypothetical protein
VERARVAFFLSSQEGSNRVEHDAETRVVRLFECVQALRQFPMRRHCFAHSDESAHNSDVDVYSPMAVQYAGEHRNTLFREDVRKIPPASALFL